jgi:hypothetical protein
MLSHGLSSGVESRRQGVVVDEGEVLQPLLRRRLAAVVHEGVATIEPDDPARRPDHPGQRDRRIAEAAADIENAVALLDPQVREDGGAVMGQAIDQNVFVFDEFRNQDFVPEIDEFGIAAHHIGHGPASSKSIGLADRGSTEV